MARTPTLLALLAALAAGAASAAGTTAGTTIENTATATFFDENGNTQPTVSSNNGVPVRTTVLAVPSFSITPNSTGTPPGSTASPFTPDPSNDKTVRPGDTNVSFKYVLTNTGNVPNETYNISRNTFNTGSAGFSSPVYYLETGTNPATDTFDPAQDQLLTNAQITGVGPDQSRTFYVVYNIPQAAADGQQMGVSPVGTRAANSAYDGAATFSLVDSDNWGRSTVRRIDANTLGPRNDANADGVVDAGNPDNVAPGGALPASYTVGNGTTPATTTTVSAGAAGARDTQTATAPASTAPQTLTFVNTVRNAGNISDTFVLSVPSSNDLDAAGFPTGTTAQILKLDGSALSGNTTPALAGDASGNGQGEEYSFLVRLVLPANAAPDAPGTVPAITVRSTSVNAPAVSDTTSDLVRIQSGVFGNATPGAPGTPAADPSLNPTKGGKPGDVISVPMDLYNSGNLSDPYTLSGTVTFTDANGASIPATITYYQDANGDGQPDLNGVGQPIVVSTATLTPGQELKVIGQVTVPAGAVTGTATVSQTATLQDAGNATVRTYTDANDTVQVGLVGGVTIKKFVSDTGVADGKTPYPAEPAYSADPATFNSGSQVKPTEVLRYVIYARNERNAVIKGFVLSDAIPTNTALFSVLATYNANGSTYTVGRGAAPQVLYRVMTGANPTWTATPPTDTTLAAGTVVQAAYDWTGDGAITAADVLPAGAELKLVFKVTVK